MSNWWVTASGPFLAKGYSLRWALLSNASALSWRSKAHAQQSAEMLFEQDRIELIGGVEHGRSNQAGNESRGHVGIRVVKLAAFHAGANRLLDQVEHVVPLRIPPLGPLGQADGFDQFEELRILKRKIDQFPDDRAQPVHREE